MGLAMGKVKVFIVIFLSANMLVMTQNVWSGGFAESRQAIVESLLAEDLSANPMPTRRVRGALPRSNARGLERVHTEQGDISIAELPQSISSVKLSIEFDTASHNIRTGSLFLLDELGRALTSDPLSKYDYLIAGHTDSDGNEFYNLQLSLRRAKVIRNYLVEKYKVKSTIQIVGFGESSPLSDNQTLEGKQKNRRVEVVRTR